MPPNAFYYLPYIIQVHVTDSVTDDDYFDYERYGTYNVTMSYTNCISDKNFTFSVDIDEV